MRKSLETSFYVVSLLLFSIVSAAAFGGAGMSTSGQVEPVVTKEISALSIPIRSAASGEVQQIPLFSTKYAQTPVAMVNTEPITLKEFALELASMHSSMEASDKKGGQDYTKMLDRLITIKLVKQEAMNIGFDRMPSVQKQIEDFALTTMIKQLLATQLAGLQVDAGEVEELYKQMAIEVKLLNYKLFAQADAEALLANFKSGGDFKALADKLVAAGKAEAEVATGYAPLKELLPAIAQAVYPMQKGDVSEIFKAENGYIIFRVEDKRVYEDQDTRLVAANQLLQQKAQKKQKEYLVSLVDKYASFNKDAEEALDFAKIMAASPAATGTEIFAALGQDQRTLVTIANDQEKILITVADVAEKLGETLYHGAEKALDPVKMEREKESVLWNMLVAAAGRLEAQEQGIDRSADYLEQLNNFEDRVLFDTFIAKAVVPGIAVAEDDARRYYYNHLEDYASPLMLKMNSLAFTRQESAEDAFKKLQAGSDLKWVSANVNDLADKDNKDVLGLGGNLLSINALPDDLQHQVTGAQQGDLFLFAGPNNLHYVLTVESAYPPEAKPYEDVRQDIGKILYAQKINEALDEWVKKLKEVYETEIFIVQNKH